MNDYLDEYAPETPYTLSSTGEKVFKNDPRGNRNVSISDQFTDPVIIYFNKVTNNTVLISAGSIGDVQIEVGSNTGISIGSYLVLFNAGLSRFSTFFVIGVNGALIDIDTPLDVDYPVGTFVDVAVVDLNVDGSSTPEVFGIRGTTVPPDSVPIKFDLTRLMFQCTTDTPVTFGLFGDLPVLGNGLVLRKRDGRYKNIFNFKSNDELANTMYDFDILSATNPAQGVDGFKGRLTFGGQDKMGVVIRLDTGEDAELIIQDDLTGLTKLRMIAEGHIVED